MKILSTNTCYVPKDLNQVIRSKDEVAAELGGMTERQIQKIWNSVEQLYKTGNYPLETCAYAVMDRFYSTEVLAMHGEMLQKV